MGSATRHVGDHQSYEHLSCTFRYSTLDIQYCCLVVAAAEELSVLSTEV